MYEGAKLLLTALTWMHKVQFVWFSNLTNLLSVNYSDLQSTLCLWPLCRVTIIVFAFLGYIEKWVASFWKFVISRVIKWHIQRQNFPWWCSRFSLLPINSSSLCCYYILGGKSLSTKGPGSLAGFVVSVDLGACSPELAVQSSLGCHCIWPLEGAPPHPNYLRGKKLTS